MKMSSIVSSFVRSLSFAMWSLRRRAAQIVPVAASFLLLVGAVQAIGMLHDVSSVLVRQQIAHSWRGAYDLLVRPQAAVSAPERSNGWINPQSMLETYGGISQQQVESIRTIAHVAGITPFATVGWQPVDILVPVELAAQGVYRVSATWNGQWQAEDVVERYVEVTDLSRLVHEAPLSTPAVQYVVTGGKNNPAVFIMPVQALQAVIGVPTAQQTTLRQVLLENVAPTPALHISLHVERLRGDLSLLPACLKRPGCWEAQGVHQRTASYQDDGVQLVRYSRTRYSPASQQPGAGELSILPAGEDIRGSIYRMPLAEHVDGPALPQSVTPGVLPFSMAERQPFLTSAIRFVPLEQACAVNGKDCYSGLYVRLTGGEQYSQRSLALLQSTAAAIEARTGLHVDILDGSSLRTISISVQGNAQTAPVANVQAAWLAVGVAVQIDHGVDALQETLLILCSIVCLLAIVTSGALVGIGRRKDALVLAQLGWQRCLLPATFTLDGLLLCLPAALLAAGCSLLANRLWAGSLPLPVTWGLLAVGMLLYCWMVVTGACFGMKGKRSARGRRQGYYLVPRLTRRVAAQRRCRGGYQGTPLYIVRSFTGNVGAKTHLLARLVAAFAITAAIFLIAIGYLLLTGFEQVLNITILGRQVYAALEGAHLLLLVVIVGAALLIAGFCSQLQLQGRREELQLLSMVGWERRDVMRRVMWDSCSPALLSGEIGVILAGTLAMLVAGALPALPVILALLAGGPLLGALLAALATIGIAWRETGRVFRWI